MGDAGTCPYLALRVSVNSLSMTSPQFCSSRDVWWSSHMMNRKISALVAAVMVMTSVSAQAMEFADRPRVLVRSVPAVQASLVGDLARRQIHQPKSLLGTDKGTMAILNSIFELLAAAEGPG